MVLAVSEINKQLLYAIEQNRDVDLNKYRLHIYFLN